MASGRRMAAMVAGLALACALWPAGARAEEFVAR
jgi:hypothetical protein